MSILTGNINAVSAVDIPAVNLRINFKLATEDIEFLNFKVKMLEPLPYISYKEFDIPPFSLFVHEIVRYVTGYAFVQYWNFPFWV